MLKYMIFLVVNDFNTKGCILILDYKKLDYKLLIFDSTIL